MTSVLNPYAVLHTVGSIAESTGGPSRTVTQLCSSLSAIVQDVELIAGHNRVTERALVRPRDARVQLHLVSSRSIAGRLATFPGFKDLVANRLVEAQSKQLGCLVHDHGLWFPTNLASWRAARAQQVPYILSPRGMLEPWALGYKAWKKKAAWQLYQQRIVAGASVVVATATDERDNIKQLFPDVPVAVIPNGVAWPEVCTPRATPAPGQARHVLFMSRIHPKKNLLALLEAWQLVCKTPESDGWLLQIAGPDELNHTQEVKLHAQKLGLADRVAFLGAVSEDDKATVLAAADLFVLPSLSENFGVVVAEAMAHGLPVIATHGSPWALLEHQGCGWWVSPTPDALASALTCAVGLSPVQRNEMGQRGRAYARASFRWDSIAQAMSDVYEWVLAGLPKHPPQCITR